MKTQSINSIANVERLANGPLAQLQDVMNDLMLDPDFVTQLANVELTKPVTTLPFDPVQAGGRIKYNDKGERFIDDVTFGVGKNDAGGRELRVIFATRPGPFAVVRTKNPNPHLGYLADDLPNLNIRAADADQRVVSGVFYGATSNLLNWASKSS